MDRRCVADGMLGEHPRQPSGLIAEVAADRHIAMRDVAALTEKQIHDREHPAEPGAKPVRGRRLKTDVQLAQPIRARSIRF